MSSLVTFVFVPAIQFCLILCTVGTWFVLVCLFVRCSVCVCLSVCVQGAFRITWIVTTSFHCNHVCACVCVDLFRSFSLFMKSCIQCMHSAVHVRRHTMYASALSPVHVFVMYASIKWNSYSISIAIRLLHPLNAFGISLSCSFLPSLFLFFCCNCVYRTTSLRFAILLHCAVPFIHFHGTSFCYQRFASRNNHSNNRCILVLKYSYSCTRPAMHSERYDRLACTMIMRNDSRTFMHILHDFDRFLSIKWFTTFR